MVDANGVITLWLLHCAINIDFIMKCQRETVHPNSLIQWKTAPTYLFCVLACGDSVCDIRLDLNKEQPE